MTTTTKPRKKAPRPVMLRNSERQTFRRCRQRWWWAWREGLRPPFTVNSLWFGTGIHEALAAYYGTGGKRGPMPAETFERWVGDERRRIFTKPNPHVDETEIVDAKDLGLAMLESYIEHYGKDDDLTFIVTEQPFQLPMSMSDNVLWDMAGNRSEFLMCGTFDGVFRDDDGKPWLIEHKTAKSIEVGHLPLDDQAGTYWAVATDRLRKLNLIKPSEELEGIRYNFLRKAMPDKRPTNANGERLNKDGSVSQKQPPALFQREDVFRLSGERNTQLQRIRDEATEMALVKAGILPVTKNTTKDCRWDCPFFQMCQLHEAGDDWQDFRDMVFTVEDPYADHRKSAAE
jgi:hypothetical protein